MGDLLIYYLSSICKNLSHIFGRKKNNDYICRVIMKKKLWTHINFIIILVAAILLELAMGVMYYSAYTNIKELAERYFERETKVSSLRASDYMRQVEVAVNNMTWVVQRNLNRPDSMTALVRKMEEHNSVICRAYIEFSPHHYPQRSHWCEPYIDDEASHTMVTTYSAPVRDKSGRVVAVIDADMEIEGLKKLIDSKKKYNSMRSFLFSKGNNLIFGDDSTFFTSVKAIKESDEEKNGDAIMTDGKGETMYVFYQRVAGPADWTMINVCYEKDIFRDIRKVRLLLFIAGVAGLLMLLFILQRTSGHLERLRMVSVEKERIDSELRVAKRIQESMLPDSYYRQDDVEVCGELLPVREVGGDLYDSYIRNDQLFFCIGDVSGKGVAAAMLMAVVHSLFRAFSTHDSNPANIMHHINVSACQKNDTNMFVTLFIGVLDLPTGKLRYCNAGHDAPIVMRRGEVEPLTVEAHLPIGVFGDVGYAEQETTIDAESTIFLYTDGLTEAKNRERKMFGLEGVRNSAKRLSTNWSLGKLTEGGGLRELLSRMVEEVYHYAGGGAEQNDDLTMLAIRYTPSHSKDMLTETLTLTNDLKEVKRLSAFVKQAMAKLDIGSPLDKELRLAVEETVVNVIEYAYPKDSEGTVEVRLMSDGDTVMVRIADSGMFFDPTAIDDDNTTLPAEEREIGGLGILLVRKIMDSVNYKREYGMNILTLIKKLKV